MPSLDAEMWAWYALTVIVVFARMASRRMLLGSFKRMLADDYLMAVTMITYTALLAIVSVLTRTPTNLINPDDHIVLTPEDIKLREYGSKLVLVTEHMQMITLWGVKGCLLFMYSRLTMSLKQNFLVKLVAGYVVVGFVVMQILWFAAWCRPFNHYWQVPPDDLNCSAETNHMITNAVINISSDIMIIILPMPVFLQSQLPLKRKIILCGVFALGIFTILAATMSKIYSLGDPYGTEWSYWYIREVSTAVIAANLPLTWTLLQRVFRLGSFHAKYGKSSNQRTGEGTSRFRSAYGNLSSMDRRPKKTTFVEPGMSFSESQEEINGKDIPLKIYQKNEVTVNITTEEASPDKRSPSPPGQNGLERINFGEANVHGGSDNGDKSANEMELGVVTKPHLEAQERLTPHLIILLLGDHGCTKKLQDKEYIFARSLKALFKGSSSSSLTKPTCNNIPAAEVFWPADLLPQNCKKARILTFGYDTKITKFTSGPTNTNSILSHGKDFLFSLGREHVQGRPMIFVAHSLGGILVKEMLALSSTSNTPTHKRVIESTAAIIFLATPHRGSPELSAIGEWARSMLSNLKFQTTSAILDTLGLKTTDLERAHEAFCRLWHQYDFQVKTFQESFGLTGIDLGVLGNKVVPHESSLIGDPREHAETLQANHKQMTRFSSAQDPNYIKVSGEIESFYKAIYNSKISSQRLPKGNQITKSEAGEKGSPGLHTDIPILDPFTPRALGKTALDTFLATLRFEGMNIRQESIPEPSLNTGAWLFKHSLYRQWIATTDTGQHLLFIKGKPGAGKSTLMREAVRQTQAIKKKDNICVGFFSDAQGRTLQRSSNGMFRSLLYQLLPYTTVGLYGDKLLAATVLTEATLLQENNENGVSPSVIWTQRQLQTFLTEVIESLSLTNTQVFVFVDALDEMEESIQRYQIEFWGELVQSPRFANLRVCLSCRHFPNITVTGCLELSLDLYNSDDIFTYIQRRLNARISHSESHWSTAITKKVHAMSSGVFLWTELVLDDVLAMYDRGVSLQIIMNQIEKMPPELETLYKRMLSFIEPDELSVARKMFAWVLAATRPLRLDEWHHIMAFIQPEPPRSLHEWKLSETFTENDDQLERVIKHTSKGLLEVSSQSGLAAGLIPDASSINAGVGSLDHEQGSARIVRIIHKSVYDFLIHHQGFVSLGSDVANPLTQCHCIIANTCLDYIVIPELNEYVDALRQVDKETHPSSSCSASHQSQLTSGSQWLREWKQNFDNIQALSLVDRIQSVQSWVSGADVLYTTPSSPKAYSVSFHSDSVEFRSQALSEYLALLIYSVTELLFHVDLARSDRTNLEVEELLSRLNDSHLADRLAVLLQGHYSNNPLTALRRETPGKSWAAKSFRALAQPLAST
ncbi:hypothetical protein FOXYSP1_12904 [Fusarium oxysporum f. sp. phaseoli]